MLKFITHFIEWLFDKPMNLKLKYLFIVFSITQVMAKKTNFVLIMTDDQGWNSLSSRSEIVNTPGLDTLIDHGILFNRFYSASPVSSPTRGSLLTGRNPERLGIPTANSGHLKQEEKTIAEIAKDAGYITGHYGKWHVGTLTKLRKDSNGGMDRPEDYSPPWIHGYDYTFATEAKVPTYNPAIQISNYPWAVDDGRFFGTYYWQAPVDLTADEGIPVPFDSLKGDDAKLIIDKAMHFIDSSVAVDVPFLTTIWLHTPHYPVVVPEDSAKKYYPNVENERDRAYYTSIEMMSNEVLRLYKHLEELKVLNNTFIFFNSDNGGAHTGNKAPQEAVGDLRSGKTHLYEGGIRVPGILVWPEKVPHKIVTDFPAYTCDIYPTVKAILGVDIPDQKTLDGVNLVPFIDTLVSGVSHPKRNKPMGFYYNKKKAWIDDDIKIVMDDFSGTWEMFNLADDMSEKHDISTLQKATLDSLIEDYNHWKLSVDNDSSNTVSVYKSLENNSIGKVVPLGDTREVRVYDLQGQLLGKYLNKRSQLSWDGYLNNTKVAGGVYIITGVNINKTFTNKVCFIKK